LLFYGILHGHEKTLVVLSSRFEYMYYYYLCFISI
jgi:hypothetical protein